MDTDSIRKILVPTDMSDFGRIALNYADILRETFGATVQVMFANAPAYPLGMLGSGVGYPLLNSREVHQRLEKELNDYIGRTVRDPYGFDALVVDEPPIEAILTTAEKINADVIIMGTHGRSGWQRAVLGSVTERVLRQTSRPVLTVTPIAAAAATPGLLEGVVLPGAQTIEEMVRNRPAIKTILCPVNLSTVAHDALEQASRLAVAFKAELVALYVAETQPIRFAEIEVGRWVPPAIREHTRYRELIVAGNAAERVLETADRLGVDLIVLGTQHKRFSDATVIGTTTERVTRFARQPVLTVVRKVAEPKGKEEAA